MGGEINLLEVLWRAGWVVKIVVALLLVVSVFSWAIILKKRKMFKELGEANQEFMNLYKTSKNLMEVMDKTQQSPFSPYATVFRNGYDEFIKIYEAVKSKKGDESEKMREYFAAFGMESLERGLKKGINESNETVESQLSTLASIGSISPFIGLFGTVWGIIHAFTGLSTGGASLETVAPGIAEALVVTAIGLAVAIPAVWFFNIFTNENQRLNSQMESFGQGLLNLIERSLITEDN